MCIRDSLKCHGIVIPLRTPSAPLLRSLAFLPIILICLRQYYLPLSLSQEFGLCSELLLHCILILLGLWLLLFYLFQVSLSGVQEFSRTLFAFSAWWLTYGTFRFLVQRDFSFSNILLSILSFILIAKVKLYILLGFVPALL